MKHLLPDWIESAEGFAAFANDCIPVYEPGGTLTGHCSGAVTGKRFVKITGAPQASLIALNDSADGGNITVGPITALGERALGVANRDVASGGKVGVLSTPGLVLPVEAGAAVVAGNEVMVDAVGRVIPYAVGAGRYAVGMALEGASGIGETAVVKIYGAPHLGAAA